MKRNDDFQTNEVADTSNVYAKYLTLKNYRYCKRIPTSNKS